MCAAKWEHKAAAPAGLDGPLVCTLSHSSVSSGSSSSRGGWGHATAPCRSAREPGWSSHLLSRFRGNVNNGAHSFLQYWVVFSAPRELSWFPNLL